MKLNNEQLQSQVKFLSKQLNVANRLLEHQDKHLTFLESLLGKSAPQPQTEQAPNCNKKLQEDIRRMLDNRDEWRA